LSRSRADAALLFGSRLLAALSAGIVLLIGAFVLRESLAALREIGLARFALDASWHPAARAQSGTFNLVPMLAASAAVTLGSALIAVPLGILGAVFCQHYAPRGLAAGYRQVLGVLAGIPSVVYGFWGLVVLVPLVRQLQPPGPSLLSGILVVALMIVPTATLLADGALASVPLGVRQAAAALGLSRPGTILWVLLPAARSGLFTGAILACGRALGETMAILMVCGNVVALPHSLFAPVRTLTANIALEMAYALGDHRSALFVSGLALLVLGIAMILLAELVRRRAIAPC
jgi:phosphate transport system permease protein